MNVNVEASAYRRKLFMEEDVVELHDPSKPTVSWRPEAALA
jgi:hypothetical protein